jgi:hypothetical protein
MLLAHIRLDDDAAGPLLGADFDPVFLGLGADSDADHAVFTGADSHGFILVEGDRAVSSSRGVTTKR